MEHPSETLRARDRPALSRSLLRRSRESRVHSYTASTDRWKFLDRDIGNMETVGVQRHGTVPLVSHAMPDVDPRGLDGHARPIHRIPFSSDPALLVCM
jgi:hypothetical protein